MNENGSLPARFGRRDREAAAVERRAARTPTTARTIAARQVSVRDAAHEFQMPAAQFSVSKYQLMPQIGTDATITAVSGSPIWRPRPNADGSE